MQGSSFELTDEVVRAGAGAGKTTKLTQQVIEEARAFRQKNGSYPRLVVTTFTRKATQELRERLILKACEERDIDLLEYVSSPSSLQISTIHGVLSLFLRRYGHLAGLDPSFTVMGSQEAQLFARRILRDLLFEYKEQEDLLNVFDFNSLCELLLSYNEACLEEPNLICHDEESLSRLLHRELQHCEAGLREAGQRILAETNDEKFVAYAQALIDWANAFKQEPHPDLVEIIRTKAKSLPRRPTVKKKEPQLDEDTVEFVKKTVDGVKKEVDKDHYDSSAWPTYVDIFAKVDHLGHLFSERYCAAKKSMGKFEMSDIELFALEAVRRTPELAEAFSSEWDYWLIDEYQDTSPIQVNLLRQLVGDRPSFVVGDPQQSIYLFRGARSEVFREREKEVEAKGGVLSQKQKNYRSCPELLQFFNDFFVRLDKNNFRAMEPKADNFDPSKVVAHFVQAPENEDESGLVCENEYCAIVSHIKMLLEQGAKYEDICILARTNKTIFELAQFLKGYGLPTHVHASAGFFERREVRDALALLKFFVNPHDNFNIVGLLRSPWCRVADEKIVEVLKSRPYSFWSEFFKQSQNENDYVIERLRAFMEHRDEYGLSATFHKALVEFGFIDFSHHHDATGRRESNLWKLVQKLKEEERRPGFNYLNFISNSFVDYADSSGSEESDAVAALEPNRINLMTVHASKGLQFKHIILPRMDKAPQRRTTKNFSFDDEVNRWSCKIPLGEEGKLTASIADVAYANKLQERELKETDRVLYVALTRAKDSVCLCWTGKPEKNSWIDRMSWDLTKPGLNQREHYSFIVDHGPWEASGQQEAKEVKNEVRSLFADLTKRPPVSIGQGGKFSVSSLLDENEQKGVVSSRSQHKSRVATKVLKSSEGVLVHRTMEILHYRPDFDFTWVAEDWFGREAEKVLEGIDYVKALSQPPILTLLEQGYVEWGFQILTKSGIMEGQIDLWGQDGNTTWLVDYKSGSSRHLDKAFKQLELYSLALRRAGVSSDIQLSVIYPFEQRVEVRSAPSMKDILSDYPHLAGVN